MPQVSDRWFEARQGLFCPCYTSFSVGAVKAGMSRSQTASRSKTAVSWYSRREVPQRVQGMQRKTKDSPFSPAASDMGAGVK